MHQDGTVVLQTIVPDSERRVTWLFDRPREVLVARTGRELDELLAHLDDRTDAGQYAVGYLAYEAGYALEEAFGPSPERADPLAWFGIYDGHEEIEGVLLDRLQTDEPFEAMRTRFEFTREAYGRAFRKLKRHIYEGDVYQVNLTGRLRFDFSGSAPALYAAMLQNQSEAYGAYIRAGSRSILSRSPELFFLRDGRRIVTRPMKGTHPRGQTRDADQASRIALSADPKSRAENLMIVDLLRNDLSVVCEPGTVAVPALFSTEMHETLIQMTSTVEGRLREDVRTGEIIRALFPCGSVTGAPKIRAMQIIRSLEPSLRGVYCGAIGWMGPDRQAIFSVAIRTAEIDGGHGRLGLGSGVVWDSDETSEFDECLLKARFFLDGLGQASPAIMRYADDFELIETMLWRGELPLLRLHLKRLADSATALGFRFEEADALEEITRATTNLGIEPHKVRLVLARDGAVRVTTEALPEADEGQLRVAIATDSLTSSDPMLRHKTTRRTLYERVHAAGLESGVDEVIFLNERGEVCQGTRSNVIIRRNGALVTPPIACGLLPGVYRAHLFQTRTDVEERVLNLSDLVRADEIFVCNAVRGLRPVQLGRDEFGRVLLIGAVQSSLSTSDQT